MRLTAQEANLIVDKDLCTRCGLCTKICWTHAMVKDENRYPKMAQNDPSDTWHSCWACQRCMAVCPTGALQICNKKPDDSVPRSAMADPKSVEALMLNRRTCRDYKPENIPMETITEILNIVSNAPSAGCQQQVQFSVISDREALIRFRDTFWQKICEKAEQGIYPVGFSELDFKLVKKGMDNGKDVIFRNAPHLLLIHAAQDKGNWMLDTAIAMTYAELLLGAHGYGTVVASFSWAAMKTMPELMVELGVPADHYLQCPLVFGIPAIDFPRGVQRYDHVSINQVTW